MGKGLEHADRSLDRKFDPKSPVFFFPKQRISVSVSDRSLGAN